MEKRAVIIGAGPAGLTAAFELLTRTDIRPIILEKSGDIGGISKTVNYKGNRIDIGGHRFFSKSDRVMEWWLQFLPLEPTEEKGATIYYRNQSRDLPLHPPAPSGDPDKVMLIRPRLSRIYFLRRFFNYPIKLSVDTLRKLGIIRTLGILGSYVSARLFPRRKEKSLEDFLINRFGSRLYKIFFKDYTEKVWGISCREISAEWGAQRIKGVSISKAIGHAFRSAFRKKDSGDIAQKTVETSQIERFMYPKFGPGQLWEEVALQIRSMGGEIHMNQEVRQMSAGKDRVYSITSAHAQTGEETLWEGDYFFSTMPVSELIAAMKLTADGTKPGENVNTEDPPPAVREVAAGLQYRDFITVGILLRQLSAPDRRRSGYQRLSLQDTWIYVQEKDVKVGRLQLFNNWSPFLVKDPATTWIGMEYFCNKGDAFWNLTEEEIREEGIKELEKIGLARREDMLDATVLRMEKTYPAYFGSYARFDEIREFTDRFGNLFLVGRNGMHKYNNADHSMLTAMVSVDNICAGIADKSNIWSINTEQEYHEERTETK